MNTKIKNLKNIDLLNYVKNTVGQRAKKASTNTYKFEKCPICGKGDHFTINTTDNYFTTWDNCSKGGTIIDFYMSYYGKSNKEAINELCSKFREQRNKAITTKSVERKKQEVIEKKVVADFTSYITDNYNNNNNGLKYTQSRLLSINNLDKLPDNLVDSLSSNFDRLMTKNKVIEGNPKEIFPVEYLPKLNNIDTYECIIPVWKNNKAVNAILRRNDKKSTDNNKTMNLKGANASFFNCDYLKTENKLILITEGVFDCLSLEMLGYKSICLNSVNMANKFIKTIKENIDTCQYTKFVLALDNDEAGNKAKEKLETGLKKLKINVSHLQLKEKDINDWYRADIEGLMKSVKAAETIVEEISQSKTLELEHRYIRKALSKISAELKLSSDGILLSEGKFSTKNKCPICRNKTIPISIYKNDKGEWTMVTCMCEKDKDHDILRKKIINKFEENMPSTAYFESLVVIKELRKYKDVLVADSKFFRLLVQVLVGTGGGKTYQTAMRMLENITNKIFTLVSTKENSMLLDYENKIAEILTIYCNDNPILMEIVKNGTIFKRLGIFILKREGNFDKREVKYCRAIVTNHKYFYNVGHIAGINPKMVSIIGIVNAKDEECEIILDEFEDYENKGMIIIPLKKHIVLDKNINGDYIEKVTGNCFNKFAGEKLNEDPFQWADEVEKQTTTEKNGIQEYGISINGEDNIKKELEDYILEESMPAFDYGRRKGRKIDGTDIIMRLACKYTTLEIDRSVVDTWKELSSDGNRKNIAELLSTSQGAARASYCLEVGNEIINNISEFKKTAKALGFETVEEFKAFKHFAQEQSKNKLFNEFLLIKQKSCLELFEKAKVYRLSANAARCNIPVNEEMKYKSAKDIEEMNIIWMPRERGVDNVIAKLIKLFNDEEKYLNDIQNMSPLMFMSLQKNLNNMYNKENSKCGCIRTSFLSKMGDDETTTCRTTDKPESKITVEKYITASYLNGVISQGLGFNDTELLIMSATPEIDSIGRMYWNESTKMFDCTPIEEASVKSMIQAAGRIDRAPKLPKGKKISKCLVVIGAGKNEEDKYTRKNDARKFIDMFVELKRKYPYNVKLNVFDKKRYEDNVLEMLINYIFKYLDNKNRDVEVEMPNIFEDGRKLSAKINAVKYDASEIVKLYNEALEQYLKDNPNKKNLSLREAEKLINIPMKTISRALKQ